MEMGAGIGVLGCGTVAAAQVPVSILATAGGIVLGVLTVSALKTSGVALPLLICAGIGAFMFGSTASAVVINLAIVAAIAVVAAAVVAAVLGVFGVAAAVILSLAAVGFVISLMKTPDAVEGKEEGSPAPSVEE